MPLRTFVAARLLTTSPVAQHFSADTASGYISIIRQIHVINKGAAAKFTLALDPLGGSLSTEGRLFSDYLMQPGDVLDWYCNIRTDQDVSQNLVAFADVANALVLSVNGEYKVLR